VIALKSASELGHIHQAGQIVARTLAAVAAAVQPGVRLSDLQALAAELIARCGATPSFLGYQPTWAPRPYPGVICLSVNEAIVHGIPDRRRLQSGDLLSIDLAVMVHGYHADAAISVGVGEIDTPSRRMLGTAAQALEAGIAAAQPGAHLGDVSHAIETVSRGAGFGIPRYYGGHGVGRAMHEDPSVPNTGLPGRGLPLRPGLVLALEPMLIAGGGDETRTLRDGWTVVTSDGSRAVHVEHTIAITTDGPRVLTQLED
jgi:methionyl aminopeptidase